MIGNPAPSNLDDKSQTHITDEPREVGIAVIGAMSCPQCVSCTLYCLALITSPT